MDQRESDEREGRTMRERARRRRVLLMALEAYEAETEQQLDRRLWADLYQGA